MENPHFISQTALAPLPKADLEGRVIMADFAVFHDRPNNSAHFVETENLDPENAGSENFGSESEDYLAGVEAGKAEAASVYEATIKVMEESLEQLKSTLASQINEIEQSHGRVILQSLEAVLPALAERSLLTDMQKVIAQAAFQETQGVLTAQIHPSNETAKSFLRASASANLEIQEVSEQSETAVNFSWDVSRVEINPQANARQCLAILSQAIPSPAHAEPADETSDFATQIPEAQQIPQAPQILEEGDIL